HGTGRVEDSKLEECVRALFKLTPKGIIESLNLLRPIYRKTSTYGHFGRELPEFSWEKTDKVAAIKDFLKI
ncbi:MAG: methionine adenosyltransferase domain-containing protein, partial [Helicobacter sp.]|nr:methionine adenosyltransferase domain-containing protein [Helicobacter sp.]